MIEFIFLGIIFGLVYFQQNKKIQQLEVEVKFLQKVYLDKKGE